MLMLTCYLSLSYAFAQDEINWKEEIFLDGTFKFIRLCKVTKGPAAGDLIMTYFQNDHSAPFGMRRSTDEGRTWSEEVIFMRNSATEYFVNPSLLQLDDGRLMLSYCKRPKENTRYTPLQGPCVRFSTDGGYNWGPETFIAWSGDYEPTAIQVPHDKNGDGHNDIYLFWSMAIVDQSFDLNTTPVGEVRRGFACGVVASYDNGETWDNFMPTKLGARIIHRNFDYKNNSGYYMSKGNMPTPVLLPNHRMGVVCEAVDKASSPWFTISDPGDWDWENLQNQHWTDFTYFGYPPYTIPHDTNVYPTNREQCFRPTFQDNTFGGAPYTCVMPNGKIVFSHNSAQKIRVFVADAHGRNAVRQQDPFPDKENSFYSCIIPLNDREVIVAAHNNIDKSQAYIRIGEIIQDTQNPTAPANLVVNKINEKYHLNWQASNDDIVVHKYEIFANNELVKTVLWDDFAVLDNLESHVAYVFSVRAVDYQGNVSIMTTALNQTEYFAEVTVYPNPVTDFLEIQTDLNEYTVRIMSLDGKVLMNSDKNSSVLNMTGLDLGTYLVSFVSEMTSIVKKVVKL
jgi:hypothetical protein